VTDSNAAPPSATKSSERLIASNAVCFWLTGLSGAGKSTTATVLANALRVLGHSVVVLDGDDLRARFWPELGFTRPERFEQAQRAAALARDAIQNGTIAICALISPYRDARTRARHIIGTSQFIEVFVSAPLQLCEARDPKGLYKQARLGFLRGLTGVDDVYEEPLCPDITICTAEKTVHENVKELLRFVRDRQFR